MSTNTGVAPVATTALAVAVKLNEGTIISSPDFISSDKSDPYNAEVPELIATAYLLPINLES